MDSKENPEYAQRLNELWQITQDFLFGIRFIGLDAGRDRDFWEHHLFSRVFDDILETSFGVFVLAREGASNSAKRELRFLIELAIKVCCVERQHSEKKLQDKISDASALLDSTNIGMKKHLKLDLLAAPLRDEFQVELGRLYGSACNWVHVTVDQINDRIDRLERGITAGKEGLPELNQLVAQVERCYAAVLVLLMHCVPSWIAGDLLVESDGTSHGWHFEGSRFIASMDEHFDYKAERSEVLEEVRSRRKNLARF